MTTQGAKDGHGELAKRVLERNEAMCRLTPIRVGATDEVHSALALLRDQSNDAALLAQALIAEQAARKAAEEALKEADYALIMSNDTSEWDNRCRNALAVARARREKTGGG